MSERFLTSFCNHPHRMVDGKPIAHECYVLPTAMLVAERRGETESAFEIFQKWKNRRAHKGLKDSRS